MMDVINKKIKNVNDYNIKDINNKVKNFFYFGFCYIL